jgi:hypothetical protein
MNPKRHSVFNKGRKKSMIQGSPKMHSGNSKGDNNLMLSLHPSYQRVPSYFEANGYVLRQSNTLNDSESKSILENPGSDIQNMSYSEEIISDSEGMPPQIMEPAHYQHILIDSRPFVIRPRFLKSFRFASKKHHEYFELMDILMGYAAKIDLFRVFHSTFICI